MVPQMDWEIILVDKPSLPIWTEPQKSNQMRYVICLDECYLLPYEKDLCNIQYTLIWFPPLARLRLMIQPNVVHWERTLIMTKTSQMMTEFATKWKNYRWEVSCTLKMLSFCAKSLTFQFASVQCFTDFSNLDGYATGVKVVEKNEYDTTVIKTKLCKIDMCTSEKLWKE